MEGSIILRLYRDGHLTLQVKSVEADAVETAKSSDPRLVAQAAVLPGRLFAFAPPPAPETETAPPVFAPPPAPEVPSPPVKKIRQPKK